MGIGLKKYFVNKNIFIKETNRIFDFIRKIIVFIDVIISCDNNSNGRDLLRIPLLKDVFERYPTIPINIDIKEDNDELIKQVKYQKISSDNIILILINF